MARAIYGYLGGPDHHQELAQLRNRIYDLEQLVGRLQYENDALNEALSQRVAALDPREFVEAYSS